MRQSGKKQYRILSELAVVAQYRISQDVYKRQGQHYIDINDGLKDEQGRLKAEYTIEGLHINEQGYRAVFDDFLKYLEN